MTGRVLDESGRPVAGQLIEIWQANASGRYRHQLDQHPAPLDPNFTGAGRCLTGPDGTYRFLTVKPGPYPWRNHHNAWRPAHIHFSVFGTAFTQRLVTQMYFPGDPLFDLDPIFQSILDPAARQRLIARYDHDLTEPEYATGYRWDIVLSGGGRTWTEGSMTELACTPGQTVGPFFGLALPYPGDSDLVGDAHPQAVRLHGTVYDGAGDGVPDALVELWQPDGAGRIPREAGSLRRDGASSPGSPDVAGRQPTPTGITASPRWHPVQSRGRPPFFAITVFARGLLNRLFTRAYLPDGDLDADPLLADRRRRAAGHPAVCRRKSLGPARLSLRHPPAGPERDRVPGVPGRPAMTNLLWPGDHRAGEHMTDQALLRSMVAVESAWLGALAAAGLAPADCAAADLSAPGGRARLRVARG